MELVTTSLSRAVVNRLTRMNLGKSLVDLATMPAKVGLAVADAGLDVAAEALGIARKTLNDAGKQTSPTTVAHLLGLDSTFERANRLARLIDDDAPLGGGVAPGGPNHPEMRPRGRGDRYEEHNKQHQ